MGGLPIAEEKGWGGGNGEGGMKGEDGGETRLRCTVSLMMMMMIVIIIKKC